MFFGKKKVLKRSLEKSYINRITKLKGKGLNDDSILELNNIIKDYLRAKFKINQSLTHEEIVNKLDEKKIKKTAKIDLSHLLTQIYQKEYFPHDGFSKEELDFLLKLAVKTLQEIELGKNIVEKVESKVVEVKKSKSMLRLEEDISSLGKDFTIDWRNPVIRKNYEKIRSDYSKLNDDEKKIIYPKLMSLFNLKKG